MSLKCRIFRDEKGVIDFVNAPNGNRSKLFDKLVDITGGNKNTALNLYALTEVDEFKDAAKAQVENFKNHLKNLVKVSPSFSILGEKGASILDSIEGQTNRIDNLEVALEMEKTNEAPLKIKIATGWEKGADGKWKYEIDSSKSSLNLKIDSMGKLGKKYNLKNVLNYPELFKAYPELANVKISVSKKGGSTTEGFFDGDQIVLGIESNKLKDFFEAKSKAEEFKKLDPEVLRVVKKFIEIDAYEDSLRDAGMSYRDASEKAYEKYPREERDTDTEILNKFGYADLNKMTYGSDFFTYNSKFAELVRDFKRGSDDVLQKSDFNNLDSVLLPVTLHEIQHWIQKKEGFAKGANTVGIYSYLTQEQVDEYKALVEAKKKAQEKLTKEGKKWYDSDVDAETRDAIFASTDYLYKKYRSAMGEEEARNVEKRLKMTPRERVYSLLQDTEENTRENQIFIPQNKTSFNESGVNKKELLSQVTNQLKESGLANNVYQMSNSEIEAKLSEIGVDSQISKQVVFSESDIQSVEYLPENEAWDVYFNDGSYLEVYLGEASSEEEVKTEAVQNLREYLIDSLPTVYRGINSEFSPTYKGVQYFAVQKRYAGVFGRNIEEFRIKSPDILDLDDWNKRWGVEKVDFGQGLLTVHQDNLSNLKEWRTRIKNSLLAVGVEVSKEELDSFIKEVENAKIIKGEDIGNTGQIVFAVKDKSLVEPINKDIQFSKQLSGKGVDLTTAGFTYNGDVYLNEDAMGLDTPIHEFGHLHLDWLKANRNDLYKAGVSLINSNKEEAKQYINIVKETQPNLEEGSEKFNNEVLAQIIGDQGAKLVLANEKSNIADWLKSVWEAIKNAIGLNNFTPTQVANMTLAEFGKASATEMLSGKRIVNTIGENNVYLRYKYDNNQVARDRFDIPNLTKISSGSDRVVFDLGDGKVLKVANTARGLAQNMQEGDPELIDKGLLPQVYETGLNYVVVEKLEALEDKTKVPVYDINTGEQYDTEDAGTMIEELRPYGQADFDSRNPDLVEVLKSYGLQDFLNYDIIYGDLTNIANWGVKDGKPVHLDAGTFGGMYMIRAYARRKDMSFQDFENVYNKTQEAKAKFGDTDNNVNFSVVAGNKLFNEPLEEASTIADEYIAEKGLSNEPIQKIMKLDVENSKRIAEEFDKMKATPNDPQTKAAYQAMIDETLDQYKKILSKGYEVEINNSEPYDSSADMIKDLRDNKRMRIFSTESGFGDEAITDEQRADNPLLQETEFKDANGLPLLANDVFRFVHDFFGHAKFGNGFGAVGEENAWNIHSRMYSPLARRAMTTETRGQNSWVNFSGVNDEAFKKRDAARKLRQEGKLEEAKKLTEEVYETMSFAEQKVGLLPEWVSIPSIENIRPENSSNYANLTEDGQGNYVFYHVGKDNYETIKKNSGATTATSREEAAALSKVGGVAMYYTRPEDSETMVSGTSKYMVKVPMNKVYDFNTDKLNLYDEAKKLHDEEHPGKAFDPNSQVAYIAKVAGNLGYEMVVSQWKNITRAQTTKEFTPVDVQISTRGNEKRFNEEYKSNYAKGYRSVIPVSKQTQLKEVYLEMNRERSKQNKYDSLYHLYENNTKLAQDDITNMVNNSDISQELKDKYFEILGAKEESRMSEIAKKETPTRTPSLEMEGVKVFAKDRVNPITGKNMGDIELELIESSERNKGNARKAAEVFLKSTDAKGKDVFLTVSPRDGKTTKEGLEKFYTSLGFQKVSDFEMIRKAQPVAPKEFDSNGETSVKTLMNFSNTKVKPLDLEGVKAAKNAAMALKVKNSSELLEKMEKALTKNGVVLFDKLSLQRSKLYNIFEINTILSSPKLQKQVKESLLALRNTEPFEIEYNEDFVIPQGMEVNQFGKQEMANPNETEKEVIESIAGLKTSEIKDALPASLASRYSIDTTFKKAIDKIAKEHKQAVVKTVKGGELSDKVEDVEGLLKNTVTDENNPSISEDIRFLNEDISEEVWSEKLTSISKVLNKIKKNASLNGVDLRNLPVLALEMSRDEILYFLDTMENYLSDITNTEALKVFSQVYQEVLGDNEQKTETIRTDSENDIVVEETLSEYEMFSKFGLVKKQGNTYRQVEEADLETLYENFFAHKNLLPEGVETVEDLKEFIQKSTSELNISDYQVDVDNLEKIVLYKKFFDFQMSTLSLKVTTEGFEKITNSQDHLTGDFVKSFNKWLLLTDNQYFKITGKGIELISNDELSKQEAIDSVPERFKQELAEYNILSHNLNLDLPLEEEKYRDINTQSEQRQKVINNPERVKKVSGQYTYLKEGILAVKNEGETFLRTPVGVFEKIFEFGNIKFYGKLDTNSKEGYKSLNAEPPFSNVDFSEYKYLEVMPEAFKTSKNYYSREELKTINDEYFGCQ